jgi:putative heme-binding domain-containing protein
VKEDAARNSVPYMVSNMNRLQRCTLAVTLVSLPVLASGQGNLGTPAEALQTLPDFKVERVLSADKNVNGSWISMGLDHKGRLLLGGQRGQPITRVTVKDGKADKVEVLKLPVSEAMGILWAFDSLYVNGSDGRRFGLFRLKDNDGDDQYESVEMLREWKGGAGEHGAHGLVPGPDGKLYTVCGNFVDVPQDVLPTSPHRNYADDQVLPRAEDGNGFGAGKKPPGGYVVRMDPDGKNPELFASGQRNTYDIAINADGEIFGFDSDMEWDWGMPWYRPVRVFQAVSGGDTGFREGTAKWPTYYFDSLPPSVNIGIGSPTGVVFGAGAKFPAKYQKAFYILDWSYGRLHAVHLEPDGAGYKGTWENFVAPKSLHEQSNKATLNLTDAVIGPDGAMWFTVGGRNTQAALYRVTYTGSESTAPAELHNAGGAEARALRRTLEKYHGHQAADAVTKAWPHLGSDDRFVRYAARIALESQPVAQWRQKALDEKEPRAALAALLALARVGGKDVQPDLLKALSQFSASSLDDPRRLEKLRLIEVTVARQGLPVGNDAQSLVSELDPLYPAQSFPLNRELCQVLLALEAPKAVEKTVKLLEAAPTQEEQILYVHLLRTIKNGWTPELRKAYFAWWAKDRKDAKHPEEVLKWFDDAGRPYADGASFPKFIGNFHADARRTLKPEEVQALGDLLAAYQSPADRPRRQPPAARQFVKAWKVDDVAPLLDRVGRGRNFFRGRAAFEAAQCLACHKFGNEGGAGGPDLTAVSSRYTRRDNLEHILEPSKVISEQYQNTAVVRKNGDTVVGRLLEENDEKLVLQPDLLKPDKVEVKKSDIQRRVASKLSAMPEGLVNVLTQDELLDLLAYMESGGRRDHPSFARQQ